MGTPDLMGTPTCKKVFEWLVQRKKRTLIGWARRSRRLKGGSFFEENEGAEFPSDFVWSREKFVFQSYKGFKVLFPVEFKWRTIRFSLIIESGESTQTVVMVQEKDNLCLFSLSVVRRGTQSRVRPTTPVTLMLPHYRLDPHRKFVKDQLISSVR